MKKRTLFFRLGAIAILLAIAAVMMVIGRGHTVYFDNKKLEVNGETYDTPYKVCVYVGDERVAKLYDKERGMATWIGQNFEMTLEITQEKGGDETTGQLGRAVPDAGIWPGSWAEWTRCNAIWSNTPKSFWRNTDAR